MNAKAPETSRHEINHHGGAAGVGRALRTGPGAIDAALAEKIGQRLWTRPDTYRPWHDLASRTGVDLRWHTGRVHEWERPWGVTDFNQLSVTLLVGLSENQLRCTLTHELVHLERGSISDTGLPTSREEAKVNLLAAQRLVDPVLFDLLTEHGKAMNGRAMVHVLGVDRRTLRVYSGWRKRVKDSTALARFEEFHPDNLPAWPPAWITEKDTAHSYAASRLGT